MHLTGGEDKKKMEKASLSHSKFLFLLFFCCFFPFSFRLRTRAIPDEFLIFLGRDVRLQNKRKHTTDLDPVVPPDL